MFAIVATVDRKHSVLSNPDGIDIFTDDNNLVFSSIRYLL